MSSGKVHDRIGFLAGCAIATPAVRMLGPDAPALLTGYAVGIIWLSPDIDLRQSLPSKRWSLLSYLWAPYRALSGHRGFSHWPVIGTASRVLYVAMLSAPVWILYSIPAIAPLWPLVGHDVPARAHLLCDLLSSGFRLR